MVSSSKPHHPSRRTRRTAAVITASLLTSGVAPVTAFAQDPIKDANNLIQGVTGNLPQAPAIPGIPAAPPPTNGGSETKPADAAAVPAVTLPAVPSVETPQPTDPAKAIQDGMDKLAQGVQALNNTVTAPEETIEVEVEGDGVPDKAKVTITKKIDDLTNGKVRLKGTNWKTKEGKGSTILVKLKGYDAHTGAENIFKQETNPQTPTDGKDPDPEIYWKITAKEDGTFEEERELPKNLTAGQGLKLAFETGAAPNDITRNKTTESLVIGGQAYVEKQASAITTPLGGQVASKAAEATGKASEAASSAAAAATAVASEVAAAGSSAAAAVSSAAAAAESQTPKLPTEPTDSGNSTVPVPLPSLPSVPTVPAVPGGTPTSTAPTTPAPASSTPTPNSTSPTQAPTDEKKSDSSNSTDTIKDLNYLLKEVQNVDKAFENLLGAAAIAALGSAANGGSIPGLPGGSNNGSSNSNGSSGSTKSTTPTTPRASGQTGGTNGNGTSTTTSGTSGATRTTTRGTTTNALGNLGGLSSLLSGGTRGTSVGGTRTSGTTTSGATRTTNGTGTTRTTTGTGARVINPSTGSRTSTNARAAGSTNGSTTATTSSAANSKPQPKHTPKPPVKTRDQLTQKNAHNVTGTLKNETLTMRIPLLKSGDWAYLYIYSADTSQKPVGIAWAQLDSTGSVKLDTNDLPDGEYTVAAVDEKDQLVGWVDMKLGEIKNAAVEGDNDQVVAAQAGAMSATDWWMIGAAMLIPLLTASMIYAFRRPRRS